MSSPKLAEGPTFADRVTNSSEDELMDYILYLQGRVEYYEMMEAMAGPALDSLCDKTLLDKLSEQGRTLKEYKRIFNELSDIFKDNFLKEDLKNG